MATTNVTVTNTVQVTAATPNLTVVKAASAINREASASSRFHIIKIETGPYKRGRWNCRDFDDASAAAPPNLRSDMIAVGPRNGSSNNSSGRTSYHIVLEENGAPENSLNLLNSAAVLDVSQQQPLLTTANSVLTTTMTVGVKTPVPANNQQQQQQGHVNTGGHQVQNLNISKPAISNLENANSNAIPSSQQSTNTPKNATPTQKTTVIVQPPQSQQQQQQPSNAQQQQQQNVLLPLSNIAQQRQPTAGVTVNRFQVQPAAGVDLNNAAAAILDSIVGSMHQQNDRVDGGRTMVTNNVTANSSGDGSVTISATSMGSSAAASAGGAFAPGSVGANVVAIDNKIEQAMDLVKTHLLYAVREEVEVLKEKIIDLEKKVFRLETENKLLREYAPPEILQQIQSQQQQQQQQQNAAGSQPPSIAPLHVSFPSTGLSASSQSQQQQQHVIMPTGMTITTLTSTQQQPQQNAGAAPGSTTGPNVLTSVISSTSSTTAQQPQHTLQQQQQQQPPSA